MASPTVRHLCLSGCPEDILLLIFEHLDGVDLYMVCLVSKCLHAIAEPSLYSTIRLTWRKLNHAPPIILLLRSILHKPQLATYIKSLTLRGDSLDHYYTIFPPPIPVTKDDLHQLTGFIDNIKVPFRDLWVQQLRRGIMDAFVALLLSQLSNVKCLFLDSNFTAETRCIGMMLRLALCEPLMDWGFPNFQRLRDVSFYVEVDFKNNDVRSIADILPLFYLPTVECITAVIQNPFTLVWPAVHPPSPSRLISLDLSYIREAHLRQLLSVTKGLKTLRWVWSYSENFTAPYNTPVIDFTQITTAISHVQHSLEDLTIGATVDSGNPDEYPTLRTKGSLSAIVNFDALKRFRVPIPFLLGGFQPGKIKHLETVIPKNIEFLIITDDLEIYYDDYKLDDHALLDVIQLWLENWKRSNPRLRGVSLLLRHTEAEWGLTMRNKFQELCARAGIQPKITKRCKDTDPQFLS